jgi:uncharacterized protein YbaA (DUF1428 family)
MLHIPQKQSEKMANPNKKEYVDGFLLPVPKKNLPAYRKLAQKARDIWMEYGALDYRECVGDDMVNDWTVPFPKTAKAKPDEVVILAWITFKSKADRNRINAAVMKDPRMTCMDPKTMPFDCKKMAYGGFKTLVSV